MAVQGVTITNAERVVYPGAGLTKLDVALHLERVAPLMLPHIVGRPLTFVRCPEGIADECFFQKHWTGKLPASLEAVTIRQSDGKRKPYVVLHDVAGLITLAQWGILEVHVWSSRADSVESPDRVVFDLDPGAGVPWKDVRAGATAVRDALAARGLESWLKTSGGKGLHIVAPIQRRSTWTDLGDFAREVADELVRNQPESFISVASKAERSGKIFVDWLRNSRGATWVAPWSMRARPDAGVSVPVPWESLGRVRAGSQDTIASLRKRRPAADPWEPLLRSRQRLRR